MQDSNLVKEMDEENEEDDGDDEDDDDGGDDDEEDEAQGDERGHMATSRKSIERVKSWVVSVRNDSPCECLAIC
jgi:hypothetical protein